MPKSSSQSQPSVRKFQQERETSTDPLPSALIPLLERYNPKRGPIFKFWMGLQFGLAGLRLFLNSPRLQLLGLVPIALTGGVFVGSIWLSLSLLDRLLHVWLTTLPHWISVSAEFFGGSVAAIAAIVLSYILFLPLVGIVSGPFRDAMTLHTERLVCGVALEEGLSLWVSLRELIKLLGLQIGILFCLAGVNVALPVAGAIPSLAIAVFLTTFDMVDPALGVKGYLLKQKLQFVRQNIALLLGFGVTTFLVFTVPLLNLLVLPVATIGGTLLVIAETRQQSLEFSLQKLSY